MPASLQAAIADRLETAPVELAPLLEVAAAVGHASVAELQAGLPGVQVERLLELASAHDLLVVEDDLSVRFAHPLIGSAVYEGLGPLVRRSLHARLAERATDPDARARHLALSWICPMRLPQLSRGGGAAGPVSAVRLSLAEFALRRGADPGDRSDGAAAGA
jgi:hypothetical protein